MNPSRMLNLRESDLPGIGRKYCLHTRGGDQLVMVVHNDERRELYHLNPEDPDEILSTVTLDDDEARMVSAIIGGLTYKPQALEQLEMALDDLIIEWLRIQPAFNCVGKPIGELNIRRETGATVIAILDKTKPAQINPGPEHVFTSGSTAVVAGDRMQLKKLKQLLQDGSG